VPYNFSSSVSPLLHNAARALNLPTRSPETFNNALDLSAPLAAPSVSSSKVSKSTSNHTGSINIPPIDQQYTGHILVSGYNISYVLPKIFPSRRRTADAHTDNDGEEYSKPSVQSRRLSIGERNSAQFMAAIDMWVPYVSRPPRSPYLVCLISFPSVTRSLCNFTALDSDPSLLAQQYQASYIPAD
jgi:hypothetical protein